MTVARVRAPLIALGVFAAAVIGALAGVCLFWIHVTSDPLSDVHAYYDAAVRLNAGLPLYPPNQDVNGPYAYFYPPLFAIMFQPLARLPYAAASAIWEALVVMSLVGTAWWIGLRRRVTWLAAGILGIPIAWSVAIGQAQVPLTLLAAIGTPWSIALAANIKLFPALIAIWWIGRREWRTLTRFATWSAGFLLLQLVLAPQATVDFLASLTLKEVGAVRNYSPYALSPALWAALLVFGVATTLRLARTRWGWAAAVALSVLTSPRLLTYMLMTLWAGVRRADRTPLRRDIGTPRDGDGATVETGAPRRTVGG